jgi:hypothetical protein
MRVGARTAAGGSRYRAQGFAALFTIDAALRSTQRPGQRKSGAGQPQNHGDGIRTDGSHTLDLAMAPVCEGFTDSRQHIPKIKVKVEPPGFPEARGLTGRFTSLIAGLTMRGGGVGSRDPCATALSGCLDS